MSSIHDATPLQLAELVKRRERLARIASRAIKEPEVLAEEPELLEQYDQHCKDYCWHLYVQSHKREDPVTIDKIKRAVARDCNLTAIDMVSERRTAQVVRARQIAMYLAKTLTPRSLPEIGRRFGGKDHTTVLHAVRKMAALIETDRYFAVEIETLKNSILCLGAQ